MTDEEYSRPIAEVPFAERLAALEASDADAESAAAPHVPDADGLMAADSLVMLLSQALQSQDKACLLRALALRWL